MQENFIDFSYKKVLFIFSLLILEIFCYEKPFFFFFFVSFQDLFQIIKIEITLIYLRFDINFKAFFSLSLFYLMN